MDLDSSYTSWNWYNEVLEHRNHRPVLEATEDPTIIDWNSFSDPDIQKGVDLMRKINKCGYEAYIVGGCVRDIVNGSKDIHDIDIATNMPIASLKNTFHTADNGGEKHGTILVENDGTMFEVTQFRTETGYSDGRHPDQVAWTSSFEEDTKRRDFTINAMGIDADGKVIDYNGGVNDLRNKVLRTVGNPTERFTEDALRIIRALRFAARFGMAIDKETMEGIVSCKGQLKNIAMERVCGELVKTAGYGAKQFASIVSLMNETGCGKIIDPDGFVDWEQASTLTNTRASNPLLPEMDKDIVVSLALLFYGTDDLKQAMDHFKCSKDQTRSVGFIYNNLPKYKNLEDLDLVSAIELVIRKDFDRLREVYHTIEGHDSYGASILPTINMLVKKALPRFNDISAMMGEIGIPSGSNYGIILKDIKNKVCEMYVNGTEPTDDQIKEMLSEYAD